MNAADATVSGQAVGAAAGGAIADATVSTVVELPLRTWVRVDTPPPTATPVRRLLTMTVLEGSL